MMVKEAVEIKLGGKSYGLRYDLNALVALEEAFGVSALALFDKLFGMTAEEREALAAGKLKDEDFSKKIKVGDLRTLIWAGVLHDNPAITREDVGAAITMEGLPEVVTKAIEALGASFRTSTPEAQKKASGASLTIPNRKTR